MQTSLTSGAKPAMNEYAAAQKGLSQEEQLALFAAIVESSGDAIISKTLEGYITTWNNAAEAVFGYTAEEMIGRHITTLIPPERQNEEPLIIERLKKGERVDHFETQRLTKDGRIVDISLTISPVRDKSGKIIGASKIARDVTQQKQAERNIRENEERLRMAVESTGLGTWEYYPLENKLKWSDECRNIYKAPPDLEVDFEFFSQHIFPDDKEIAEKAIAEAMVPGNGGNYDVQYRILRYTDKKPVWISAKGKVFFNEAWQPERFIGTVVDINDEKEQEIQLKDSIELFTVMANNVPAMIWMSGNDKFNDYFNNSWLEFTGRTLEQEKNEGWLDNVHPDDRQKCIDRYKTAWEAQEGFYSEYRLKRFDGEYRWIADNSVPRYQPNGEFAGFISACIDIDDQKRYHEKILESELMLKTISGASPVGLWMTDTERHSTFVNKTWIAWTGKTLEDQLASGSIDKLFEEDRDIVRSKFEEAFNRREKYSAEFRLPKEDGSIRWCLTEGYPYYDINNQFAGYTGSVTDITELKKLEQRKDDFIRMASHELKTPITSINGYVQLLQAIYTEMNSEKLLSSSETVRSSLQTIGRQVSKLTRLVTELLDLSRIESGKLEMFKDYFEFSSLVDEIVETVKHTSPNHELIVHNGFTGNLYGDKDRIGQVLVNLLTNAIKYSPGSGRVELTTSGNEKAVKVEVKDYGIGIDKKDHEKIFERFYRVEGKSEQTFPGFGIGLFITSEIVNRHHGHVEVESEKGKGSVFSVTLPVEG